MTNPLIEAYGIIHAKMAAAKTILTLAIVHDFNMPGTIGVRVSDNTKTLSRWITGYQWQDSEELLRQLDIIIEKFNACDMTVKVGDWRFCNEHGQG